MSRIAAVVIFGFGALMLGGCSADLAMVKQDWNWWKSSPPTTAAAPLERGPAPATALIGPDGSCPPAAEPPLGIAVGMTECDVVHVAGPTTQMQVATNERGDRTLVLTYPTGAHAGIYHFTAGILKSVEEVPMAEKPAKPARHARPKKRAARPAPQAAAAPPAAR